MSIMFDHTNNATRTTCLLCSTTLIMQQGNNENKILFLLKFIQNLNSTFNQYNGKYY